jgi:hypothetical protein
MAERALMLIALAEAIPVKARAASIKKLEITSNCLIYIRGAPCLRIIRSRADIFIAATTWRSLIME